MEPTIAVLFATQTGTAEEFADKAVEDLAEAGHAAKATNLCDYSVDELREQSRVLIIAATWGEGEPPDDCVDFFEAFMEAGDLDLSHQQFAVLALGDTAYDDFCKHGKDYDETLEKYCWVNRCSTVLSTGLLKIGSAKTHR